jgi:hypothetical protein
VAFQGVGKLFVSAAPIVAENPVSVATPGQAPSRPGAARFIDRPPSTRIPVHTPARSRTIGRGAEHLADRESQPAASDLSITVGQRGGKPARPMMKPYVYTTSVPHIAVEPMPLSVEP